MSGFALRVCVDTTTASPPRAEQLLQSIANRGADRQLAGVFDGIEVAHAALHATPEAASEFFPVAHPTQPMWVVADARIDDQARLRSELAQAGCSFAPVTDADLILAAHEVWGDDAQCHLIGDFAYALWSNGRVLCARDVMGMKPLWWGEVGGDLVIGSTLRVVLDQLDQMPPPNEQFVAEFLTWQLRSNTTTAYDGIQRLGPGQRLLCEGSVVVDTVDQLRIGPGLHLEPDEGQVRVRAAVEEAVRDRLRAPGPVACDVSGGLDSTTIFGLARLLAPGTDVHAMSEVYPGQPHDETQYIDEALAGTGVTEHRINGAVLAPVDLAELSQSSGHVHYFVDSLRPMMRAAADAGCRVRLTGQGGDEAFSLADSYVLDRFVDHGVLSTASGLFRGWGIRGALREAAGAARRAGLHRAAAAPLVGALVRNVRARRAAASHCWISPRLMARQLEPYRPERPAGRSPHSRLERFRWYAQPTRIWSYEELDRDCEGLVEVRHPFADRRFVELMLQLPNHVVNQAGRDRYLHRRAFADVVPAAVLQRRDKASFGSLFTAAAVANTPDGFESLASHQLGWTIADLPPDHSTADLLDRWCAISVSAWIETTGWVAVDGSKLG